MKVSFMKSMAAAAAMTVAAGAADAATTYDISLSGFGLTGTATAVVDFGLSSPVISFDLDAITGETLTGSSYTTDLFGGEYTNVFGTWGGDSYVLSFAMPANSVNGGTWALLKNNWLPIGIGTYSATEVDTPAAVPLPAAAPLLLAGLAGLAALRRRKA